MIVGKRSRSDAGSCNFHSGFKLCSIDEYIDKFSEWDHQEVFEFCNERSGNIKVRICKKCLKELFGKTCLETLIEEEIK